MLITHTFNFTINVESLNFFPLISMNLHFITFAAQVLLILYIHSHKIYQLSTILSSFGKFWQGKFNEKNKYSNKDST